MASAYDLAKGAGSAFLHRWVQSCRTHTDCLLCGCILIISSDRTGEPMPRLTAKSVTPAREYDIFLSKQLLAPPSARLRPVMYGAEQAQFQSKSHVHRSSAFFHHQQSTRRSLQPALRKPGDVLLVALFLSRSNFQISMCYTLCLTHHLSVHRQPWWKTLWLAVLAGIYLSFGGMTADRASFAYIQLPGSVACKGSRTPFQGAALLLMKHWHEDPTISTLEP